MKRKYIFCFLLLIMFFINVSSALAITFSQDTWCAIANCGSNYRNIWCVRGIIGNGYENPDELGIMENAPRLCQSAPPDPCANPNPGGLRRASDIPAGCPGGPSLPPPVNTTDCNGATYKSDCPDGGTFFCPMNGGTPQCLGQDDNICNGTGWSACPEGQTFSCESTGGVCSPAPEFDNYLGIPKNAYQDMRSCLTQNDPNVNCHDKYILPLLTQAGDDPQLTRAIGQAESDAVSDHLKLDPPSKPIDQPKKDEPKPKPIENPQHNKQPDNNPVGVDDIGPLSQKFNDLAKDAVKPTVQKYYNQDGQEITLDQAKSSGLLPYLDIVSNNPNLKAGDDFRIDLPPGTNLGDIIVTTSKDVISGATTITAVVAVDTVKLLRGPNSELDPNTNADVVNAINSVPSNYDPYAMYKISGPIEGEAIVHWTPPISISASDIEKTIPDYRMIYSKDGKKNWAELPAECGYLAKNEWGCMNDPSLNGYYSIVKKSLATAEISTGLAILILITSLAIWFLIGYFIYRALVKRKTNTEEDKWGIRHPVWGAIIIELAIIFLLSFAFQSSNNFIVVIWGVIGGAIGLLIHRWKKKGSVKN